MQTQNYSTSIAASKERVWNVLWGDETFRDWASIIDEGQYMVGELAEGSKVQFLSGDGGYGVLSLIEKLVPNEYVSIRQLADVKAGKEQPRTDGEGDWAGGRESYSLHEADGLTTLTVSLDVPEAHAADFESTMPRALQRIKELAEA